MTATMIPIAHKWACDGKDCGASTQTDTNRLPFRWLEARLEKGGAAPGSPVESALLHFCPKCKAKLLALCAPFPFNKIDRED